MDTKQGDKQQVLVSSLLQGSHNIDRMRQEVTKTVSAIRGMFPHEKGSVEFQFRGPTGIWLFRRELRGMLPSGPFTLHCFEGDTLHYWNDPSCVEEERFCFGARSIIHTHGLLQTLLDGMMSLDPGFRERVRQIADVAGHQWE